MLGFGGNLCFSYRMQGAPSQVWESVSPKLLPATREATGEALTVSRVTANPGSGVLQLFGRPNRPGRPAGPSPAHLHPAPGPDGWGPESCIYFFIFEK